MARMTVAGASEPRVLERSEHTISRQDISPQALKVLYRLQRAGYRGLLVGGSVRDLMLSGRPKDFDIGTDARPPQIKRLFRNSRIIGRRFRLVHVFFHDEVVEVSTFRRDPDPKEQRRGPGDLLVTSDNTYGTPRQDAFRRDFTVNALFYDIADYSVIDYVGGIEDLERRIIRVIGDPDVRFQEDPVRMMRACEFAGRLGLGIDPPTQESIQRNRKQLDQASPARLTEEVLQLLRCGSAGASLQWMLELGLLEVLLPEVRAMLGPVQGDHPEYTRLLPAIDDLQARGGKLTDATLLGILLLPQVIQRRDETERKRGRPLSRGQVRSLVEQIVAPFGARFTLSRARIGGLHHALTGFFRLCEPRWLPRARVQLAHRPYFDDALGLFELMVEATGEGEDVLKKWQAAARHRANPSERPPPRRQGRRRRGRRR